MPSSILICTAPRCRRSLANCQSWRKATSLTGGSSTTEKPRYLPLQRAEPWDVDRTMALAGRVPDSTVATHIVTASTVVATRLHPIAMAPCRARECQPGRAVHTGFHHDPHRLSITMVAVGRTCTAIESATDHRGAGPQAAAETTSIPTSQVTENENETATASGIGKETDRPVTGDMTPRWKRMHMEDILEATPGTVTAERAADRPSVEEGCLTENGSETADRIAAGSISEVS